MTAPVVAFFNNNGGVGKTSLVYHIAWMYADLGVRVVAVDLDPQANLTAAFLDEERLEGLWAEVSTVPPTTVYRSIVPLLEGVGDVAYPSIEIPDRVAPELALVPGDLALARFEDELSDSWPKALDGQPRPFRVLSAFWRIAQRTAVDHRADVILLDLGPNLGAINRAALIAADHVVFPLSPDLFSLQGLKNLGPTLTRWRKEWTARLDRRPEGLDLPSGSMSPLGYIVLQHSVRLDRPVKAHDRWIGRIPSVYREAVLATPPDPTVSVHDDPYAIALLKHYRSLMPMAQEARKPMFHLKPADGAIGSHFDAAAAARKDFESIARSIARRLELSLPSNS